MAESSVEAQVRALRSKRNAGARGPRKLPGPAKRDAEARGREQRQFLGKSGRIAQLVRARP